MTSNRESRSLIFLTLIAAILLSLLPLPEVLLPFKPYWLAMVLIYWTLETQHLVAREQKQPNPVARTVIIHHPL